MPLMKQKLQFTPKPPVQNDPKGWGIEKSTPPYIARNGARAEDSTDAPEPQSEVPTGPGQEFAAGGAIPDPDNDPTGGGDTSQFDVGTALQTVDDVLQYGYKKSGLTQDTQQGAQQQAPAQGFDAGGDVPDQPQGQSQGQPPSIVGLVQGTEAMPAPQAAALEKRTGAADPNTAKLQTLNSLAQQGGPDAAWPYMQSLRKQYDLSRTLAAVKANQGQLPQSTQAATLAMHNILDGTSTQFTPGPDGKSVQMSINKLGRGSAPAKRYDDGGTVEDDDSQAIPDDTTQTTEQPDTAARTGAEATPELGNFILSIPQYLKMLMGKAGQYDELYDKGPAAAANAARASDYAQSVSGAVSGVGPEQAPAVGRNQGAISRVLNPGAAGMADEGTPDTSQSSSTAAPPQQGAQPAQPSPPMQVAAQPPPMPTAQPQFSKGWQPTPPKPKNEHDLQEESFGKENVAAADAAYGAASEHNARRDMLVTGRAAGIENTSKEKQATARNDNAKDIATLRYQTSAANNANTNATRTANTNTRAETAIAINQSKLQQSGGAALTKQQNDILRSAISNNPALAQDPDALLKYSKSLQQGGLNTRPPVNTQQVNSGAKQQIALPQGGAPPRKLYNGQWYVRGPNGQPVLDNNQNAQ